MDFIVPSTISADAQLISSNVAEADYSAWSDATTYAVDDYVIVTADGIHRVYKSAVGSNLNHYPPDNIYDDTVTPATGYWIDISATNRWKMFDGLSRASTSNQDSIEVSFKPGAKFNALAILNIEAKNLTVIVTDPTEGEVYNRDVSLVDLSAITGSFYNWYFSSPVRKQSVVLTDLPAYPDATIKIILSAPGETVTCGEVVPGWLKYAGKLEYGYSVGIKDYSTKEKDELGNPMVEEGVYSDTIQLRVAVDTRLVYDLKRTLGRYRATPLVFIGTEQQQETIVYGFYIDFNIAINTRLRSYGSIEVEELS